MRFINHNQRYIFFLIFFAISGANANSTESVFNSDADYICIIERISAVEETKSNQYLKLLERTHIGEKFTVERKTGIMAGELKNSYLTKPQIIDFGTRDNSFKAITTIRVAESGAVGSVIQVISIKEFVESQKKPFVFLDNDYVIFGSCEHF
jgi:hypothetical protein